LSFAVAAAATLLGFPLGALAQHLGTRRGPGQQAGTG